MSGGGKFGQTSDFEVGTSRRSARTRSTVKVGKLGGWLPKSFATVTGMSFLRSNFGLVCRIV